MTTFSASLANFETHALEQIDKVRRAAIINLFNLIVDATPVDEGRLRGNWQTNAGSPKLGELSEIRGPSEVKAEIVANLGKVTDTVFFTNNLPYAHRIEYEGWSAFARNGMVRPNVLRWNEIVNSVAKALIS